MNDWNIYPNDVETITTTNMEDAKWLVISLADEPVPTVVYIYQGVN